MDRRDFLTASLMTVAAFKKVSAERPSAAPPPPVAAAALSEARFRVLVGSRFQMSGSEWRGTMQLAEVRSGPDSRQLEQFATLFVADASAPAAGLYEVSHPDLGRFALRLDGAASARQRAATFALLRASD
jgi:hypothetical protein